MCGCLGYIGVSKNPPATFQLITRLFEQTEVRGVDAAGFWGTEAGDGRVIYHKEPVKSSILVRKAIWSRILDINPDLLLLHCRQASQGVGEPADNRNNHPFVSADSCLALIHNGRIGDEEYQVLKLCYQVYSECDSEVLLRILEAGERYGKYANAEFPSFSPHLAKRFAGLRDIWSMVHQGHMAVAVGEKRQNTRYLWLFRNFYRTLWLVDLREQLGQVFFCSTPEIWHRAAGQCDNIFPLRHAAKLLPLPPDEIWFLETDTDHPVLESITRFSVCREGPPSGQEIPVVPLAIKSQGTISHLGEGDGLPKVSKPALDLYELQVSCQRLRDKICEIEMAAPQLRQRDFEELLHLLQAHDNHLEDTLLLVEARRRRFRIKTLPVTIPSNANSISH